MGKAILLTGEIIIFLFLKTIPLNRRNILFFRHKLFCWTGEIEVIWLFCLTGETKIFNFLFQKAISLNGRNRNILIFCQKLFCLTGEIKVIWFLVRKAIPLYGWNQNILIFHFLRKVIPLHGWDWNIIISCFFAQNYSS